MDSSVSFLKMLGRRLSVESWRTATGHANDEAVLPIIGVSSHVDGESQSCRYHPT